MRIAGASVWEQDIYDHLVSHGENEKDALITYDELARDTSSAAVAYLIGLILDDERRHHRLLNEMAETIRTSAELSGEPTPIPSLGRFGSDKDAILAATEQLIGLEENDNRTLERLARELKDVRTTTMWELLLRLMQDDNAKHRRILAFIRDRVRES
jgi:rubrerythrin